LLFDILAITLNYFEETTLSEEAAIAKKVEDETNKDKFSGSLHFIKNLIITSITLDCLAILISVVIVRLCRRATINRLLFLVLLLNISNLVLNVGCVIISINDRDEYPRFGVGFIFVSFAVFLTCTSTSLAWLLYSTDSYHAKALKTLTVGQKDAENERGAKDEMPLRMKSKTSQNINGKSERVIGEQDPNLIALSDGSSVDNDELSSVPTIGTHIADAIPSTRTHYEYNSDLIEDLRDDSTRHNHVQGRETRDNYVRNNDTPADHILHGHSRNDDTRADHVEDDHSQNGHVQNDQLLDDHMQNDQVREGAVRGPSSSRSPPRSVSPTGSKLMTESPTSFTKTEISNTVSGNATPSVSKGIE